MASQHFVISANSKPRSDTYVHMRNAKDVKKKQHIRRECMRKYEMRLEAKAAGCSVADLM